MARRSRSRLAFFLILLSTLNFSCRNHTDHTPTPGETYRGFYHWTTHFALDTLEKVWLDSLVIDRLYVKFFDLDWDPEAAAMLPLASVQLDTIGLAHRRVIPAVFITNRSMAQAAPATIPLLAQRMVEKIDQQFRGLGQPLTEIHLDCDWTAGTRANYFALLQQLQLAYKNRGIQLSATIRLHQLRYPERTGVPPVNKGVLMFYNMGDLPDWEEPNSILNLEKAAAYLPPDLTYPLQLDLALPLFRWAVLFRDGRMIKLINEPDTVLLAQSAYYRLQGHHRYEVIKSTYLDGYYLYRGDQLRMESVTVEDLKAALQLVADRYPPAVGNLIFYHLDTEVLRRYQVGDILGLF